MKFYFARTKNEYENIVNTEDFLLQKHRKIIQNLIPSIEQDFIVRGYSYTAKKEVNFLCNFRHSGGFPKVNWRECLVCPESGFNNRMRFSIQIIDTFLNLLTNSNVYIMEKVTPMFAYLANIYPQIIGSEFLGNEVSLGATNELNIRNEDCTKLTFKSESFDAILSYDVFEHIPNFREAFQECWRVLKHNGQMLFSVPFSYNENNLTRAIITKDGTVQHLLEPEYHGNPVGKGEGILCFQHFGWEILNDLKKCGFKDAYAIIGWAEEFGYFMPQIQFLAVK